MNDVYEKGSTMIFKRGKKETFSIDPNDPVALAHEREVLARENLEAASGSENEIPTDVGLDLQKFDTWRGKVGGVRLMGNPRGWTIPASLLEPPPPEDFKDRD